MSVDVYVCMLAAYDAKNDMCCSRGVRAVSQRARAALSLAALPRLLSVTALFASNVALHLGFTVFSSDYPPF